MADKEIITWRTIHEDLKKNYITKCGLNTLVFPETVKMKMLMMRKLLEFIKESGINANDIDIDPKTQGMIKRITIEMPLFMNEMGFKNIARSMMRKWKHLEGLKETRRILNVAINIGIGSDTCEEKENMDILLRTQKAMKEPILIPTCNTCGGAMIIKKVCSGGCGYVYCSRKCQKKDWYQHRNHCYKLDVRKLIALSQYLHT